MRYNTTQSLTTTQKKTSKTNIGAVGYDAYQNLATTDKTIARDNIGAVGYEKQKLTIDLIKIAEKALWQTSTPNQTKKRFSTKNSF